MKFDSTNIKKVIERVTHPNMGPISQQKTAPYQIVALSKYRTVHDISSHNVYSQTEKSH